MDDKKFESAPMSALDLFMMLIAITATAVSTLSLAMSLLS